MTREQLQAHLSSHTKENSWWLLDAKGIEVTRVCAECIGAVKSRYKPEIFDVNQYENVVEEPIEPE